MPMHVQCLPITECMASEDFRSAQPYLDVTKTAESHPHWWVVFNSEFWHYTHDIPTKQKLQGMTLKELPQNAPEFPFGVDAVESKNAGNPIPDTGSFNPIDKPLADELEYPFTTPTIMPRSSLPDDDEIPF